MDRPTTLKEGRPPNTLRHAPSTSENPVKAKFAEFLFHELLGWIETALRRLFVDT
jgi:hypothetical protein